MEKYLHKIEKPLSEDPYWNIPEQKQGIVNVIGGNAQSFRTPTRVAEYLAAHFPVKTVNLVLPDALHSQLPPLENLVFLPSTDSGSFSSAVALSKAATAVDFNLLVGDFSKNSITRQVVAEAAKNLCSDGAAPLLITRDAVDLLTEASAGPEEALLCPRMIILGSLAQLQKLFRVVYYPKVLLLSQSLMQVADALHKFTLSYAVGIITLHNGQILIAKDGIIYAIPLESSSYSPLSLWTGELAVRIAAFNLYNPQDFSAATVAAVLGHGKAPSSEGALIR